MLPKFVVVFNGHMMFVVGILLGYLCLFVFGCGYAVVKEFVFFVFEQA